MPASRREILVTRHFAAGPETVFDAWLDPTVARRFLFATDSGVIIRCEIDARVGGGFTIVDRRPSGDVEHVGHYTGIARPSRLVFDFTVSLFPKESTRIAITLTAGGNGTDLTLTSDNIAEDQVDRATHGWNTILDALARAIAQPAG